MSVLPDVWPLVVAVFVASLLGSMHCAGMCGGLLLFAVGDTGRAKPNAEPEAEAGDAPRPRAQGWRLHAAYHLGRLTTYSLLGAAAGAAGAALDLAGRLAGLQRAAAILAGCMLIGFGLIAAGRALGARIPHARVPKPLLAFVERSQRAAFALRPLPRAGAIGLLTTFLPCGWLYAFAITAAGTGSAAIGALTMAVFWLGTLPVMMTLGIGLRAMSGALGKHLPLVSACLVIIVGASSVIGRARLNPDSLLHRAVSPVSFDGHDAAVDPDAPPPPCCAGEGG